VLEGLATVSALTDAGIATDGRRDLGAVGIANLVVAATAAGPPIGAPVATALGLLRQGGTGRLAPISRLVTVGIGGLVLGGFLPLVPHGALVGLVLAIGLRLIDPEPLRLLWRAVRQDTRHRVEIAFSALISLAVVVVAVVAGLTIAVAVGAVACLLVFTAAMAGSAIRRVFDGAAILSRVRRSAEQTATLLRQRHAVAVLELAGPLFFGNVSPLARALEQARASGARHVVVDLSRVVRVDLSGARRLMAIVRQQRAQGLVVVLAPIRPGHPVADYLGALGVQPGECFAELTDALAAAEASILEEAGVATPSYATAEEALRALGVPAEHAQSLAQRAETRAMAAGEMLCHGGDPADAVYVLMQGQADVLVPRSRVLLAHLSAGAVVGERALFEAGTRSADVVCAVPSRVLILSGPTLAALLREASPASLALVLAITRNTAVSLQHANAAIERLEV
jgi:MFS superfamily sulfate permease-like transporter